MVCRHPQLRHFISTVDREWIYFANSYDIYALHLPSQRKSLLVTLPFSPRCLVAGLGWICVGGDQNGDSAFIELNKKDSDAWFHHAGPTSPPDSPQRATRKNVQSLGQNVAASRSYPELVLNEFGGDIVNSITLHELATKGESSWHEPVALLR